MTRLSDRTRDDTMLEDSKFLFAGKGKKDLEKKSHLGHSPAAGK